MTKPPIRGNAGCIRLPLLDHEKPYQELRHGRLLPLVTRIIHIRWPVQHNAVMEHFSGSLELSVEKLELW